MASKKKLKPGLFFGIAVAALGVLLITGALSLEIILGIALLVVGVMMIVDAV